MKGQQRSKFKLRVNFGKFFLLRLFYDDNKKFIIHNTLISISELKIHLFNWYIIINTIL